MGRRGGGGVSLEAPQLSPSISSEGQAVIPEDAAAESFVGPAVLLLHTHTHTHTWRATRYPSAELPDSPDPS